jgi:EAL domain-containing protein (putative c-di-GMP-specific phosphodiesterase class I)
MALKRGMSMTLDQAAYRAVLTSFAALEWTGKLFLNLLPGSLLRSARLPRDLRRAIADAGLHPSQIILELTEHDPIPNAADLLRVLDPFLEEGMQLSLDDVGAGFANLRLICELQPHEHHDCQCHRVPRRSQNVRQDNSYFHA